MSSVKKNRPRILVVDDQPINVRLLQRKLERADMEALVAYNSRDCLQAVADCPPDLILLDIMMSVIDGIEVCRRLKEKDETGAIPIIFITAKTSKEGKLLGLGAGAVDYTTKPIDLDGTLARVQTQLRIQKFHRQNLELQKRLSDSRHPAAEGAITQGIAHNLNNLLGVVVDYLDLIKRGEEKPGMVELGAEFIDQAVRRIVEIMRQLNTIASEETYSLSIDANQEIFEDILGRLLINAFDRFPSQNNERPVAIETDGGTIDGEEYIIVSVHDCGEGIDPDVEAHIFGQFISSKATVGRGMGLTAARSTIRNLGGDLELSAREGDGISAVFTHPV